MHDARSSAIQLGSPSAVVLSGRLHPSIGLGAFWLVLLILVCALVAVGDGLSRGFLPDGEPPGPSLEYQPNVGAYALAFVSLPLILGFSASQGLKRTEALLLWFVFCTTAYVKDFSYIRIPGTPLFVTDMVLLSLFPQICRFALRWRFLRSSYFTTLVIFWLVGGVALLGALLSGVETLRAMRDAALVGYSLFLLAAFVIVRSWPAVQRVLLFAALGASLYVLNAVAWFLAQPGQRRYVAFGVYALGALIGSLVLWRGGVLRAWQGFSLALLFSAGLVLANARTLYVGLAGLLLLLLLLGVSAERRPWKGRLKLLIQAALLAALLLVVGSQTQEGAALLQRTAEEVISGTVAYADDPNAQFRMLAWAEAAGRFLDSPILGEGFGIPFTFAVWDEDVRPHNTYLTVLYKMGLVGFVPLVLLLGRFHWTGWRVLWLKRADRKAVVLCAILLAHLAMCFYGGLNLLLESPFLASVFWILTGVGVRSAQLLLHESGCNNPLQEHVDSLGPLRGRSVSGGRP